MATTGPTGNVWLDTILGLNPMQPTPIPAQPVVKPAPYNPNQGPNEMPITYLLRRAIMSIPDPGSIFTDTLPNAILGAHRDAQQGVRELTTTPNQKAAQAARSPKAADVFPATYTDPRWDQMEAAVAAGFHNPTLADALAKLRTYGERSNSNQTSTAGAKTPYQITPETRAGIMKQYGFDPWSSPQNAVRGAAIAATTYTGTQANFNDPNVLAKAAGGYFGGAKGAANPFGSASDGGTTTADYVSRVTGQMTNPYDPSYDIAALGEINKEGQALMQPSHFSVAGPGPAPELPKPIDVPKTDFSQADQALAAMQPVAMTEKEKLQRERRGFFSGLAQAMMSTPANEGLGSFFMRLGGGALAGRQAAEDQIQKEADRFDDKMAAYHAAVFQNDMVKAKVAHDEAAQQVEQTNQYNRDNWTVKYNDWKGAGGTVDISGTNAVIQRRDQNGNVSVDVLPIASAVNAALAQQRANLFSSMGGRTMAGNQQITAYSNALVARQAISTMAGGASNQAEKDAAATAAPAMYATFLTTHGGVADVIGADGMKSLEDSINKQLLQSQMIPGSQQYVERHDQMMATELTKLALADPQIMNKMMVAGKAMGSFNAAEALGKATTRTATDAKGQTTTSTTMPASEMFDNNTINGVDLTPYGYQRY